MRRLIIEKLLGEIPVRGRWGMNYIAIQDIPKGLPKVYPINWYKNEVEYLARKGILLRYKKSEKMYRLNINMKKEIEKFVKASK